MSNFKSFFMSAALLYCYIPAYSQITLSAYDVLYEGQYNMALDTGFLPGSAGTGKVWDFKSLKPRNPFKYKIVRHEDNGDGNTSNLAKIDGPDTFAFYFNNGSTCDEIIDLQNFDKVEYWALKRFSYPFGLNDELEDSFRFDTYIAGIDFGLPAYDSLHLSFKMVSKTKVDAWGTLQLPSGDVQSLRIASETSSNVMVFGKTIGKAYQRIHSFDENDTERVYQWYGKGKGGALATYHFNTREMEYRVSATLPIKDVKIRSDLQIANPVSEVLHIRNTGLSSFNIRLIDMRGVGVLTGVVLSECDTDFNLISLNKGMYILQMQDLNTGSITYEKIVKE